MHSDWFWWYGSDTEAQTDVYEGLKVSFTENYENLFFFYYSRSLCVV